jgi:hypothetical protein
MLYGCHVAEANPFSILYQRGIYPEEDFMMVKKYGLNMLVTTDDGLQTYLKKIMSQLNGELGNDDCRLCPCIVFASVHLTTDT